MHCSRPTSWILALVYGALVAVGCTATADTSPGESGSLTLNLEVGSVDIDAVDYLITGDGTAEGGTIDTSAPGSTASVEVFGLLPGDYTVTLSATATDGVTMCEGSEDFSVDADALTEVMVYLRCKLPETLGGVRVNGEFNICAVVDESVVKPLQTSVGNVIELSATGEDAEGDDITYIWSGTGGDIDDPNAMDTTYTCAEVGKHSVTITVSDDGFEYCMDSWTTVVTCVEGEGSLCDVVICKPDGNECTENNCDPSDGICKDENVDDGTDCKDGAGMCMDGKCIDADLCEGADCDDGEECTDDSCNPLNGECINAPVDDGTDCGDGTGMCVGGECIAEDLCDGLTCEDTGNECTVGVCNMQTGVCDPMDVPDGTECNVGVCSAGECVDNNMCDGVDCTSAAECVNDGTCDPADGQCIPGSNKPADTACTEGGGSVCDDAGVCVACNSADQCPEDTNDCTDASCVAGSCGQADLADGTMCDLQSVGDGVCMSGVCEAAAECASSGDCDDGNECTSNDCVEGSCEFAPTDGATCDVTAGVPGTCDATGSCIGLCADAGTRCDDGNQCTDDACDTATGDCSNTNNDAKFCDTCGGTSCSCEAGSCVSGCTVPDPVDAAGIPMACRNSFNQAVSTFPIDLLNVTADACLISGDAVNFAMDPTIALDTAFLQAAAETLCDLGTLLTEADVTVAQVSIDAVAGATCTPQLSVLPGVPVTVVVDITLVSGSCGASGVVEVNSGISLPLPPVTLPCTMGAAGSTVPICSTGTVPLSVTLASPPPPPAYTETYVGVNVGGSITVAFACNTSSTTDPAPGVTVNCTAPNPTGECAALPPGDVGETPFPESDCDFTDGFPGDCETVPVGVDPSTVCATFTVE